VCGLLVGRADIGNARPFLEFLNTGLPVAIFSQPFSGHDWMYVPAMQRAGKRVVLAASSDYADIDRIVALLRVPVRMRQSRVLLVGPPAGTPAACVPEQVKQLTGVELVSIDVPTVVAAHQTIERAKAEAEAEQYWLTPAQKIVEPTPEEIVKSAAMYLALMLANWGGGVIETDDMMTLLHRVVFYGNHLDSVRDLAYLMGLRVVAETGVGG